MKVRAIKMNVTHQDEGSKIIKNLWAIIGICNFTLIQVFSVDEPTDLMKLIDRSYQSSEKKDVK